jgi:hypothetical protein
MVVPRPSAERNAHKDSLRPAYHSASLAPLRAHAEALYEQFASG